MRTKFFLGFFIITLVVFARHNVSAKLVCDFYDCYEDGERDGTKLDTTAKDNEDQYIPEQEQVSPEENKQPEVFQFTRDLYRGMLSDMSSTGEVARLQEFLKDQGYYPYYNSATGVFGNVTETSLKQFQQTYNLPATGRLDQATRLMVNRIFKELAGQYYDEGNYGPGPGDDMEPSEEGPSGSGATTTVVSSGSDLSIKNLGMDPSTPVKGQPFFWSYSVVNAGNADIAGDLAEGKVYLTLSGGSINQDQYRIITENNTCANRRVIRPKDECGIDKNIVIDKAGKYTLSAVVDPNLKLQETNENNNVVQVVFDVQDLVGAPAGGQSQGGGGSSQSATSSPTVVTQDVKIPPVVNISISSNSNNTITISWDASNAPDGCVSTWDPGGALEAKGSNNLPTPSEPVNYAILCAGPGGNKTKTIMYRPEAVLPAGSLLKITYPRGGEMFKTSTEADLKWEEAGLPTDGKLVAELYKNNNDFVQTLSLALPRTGDSKWQVTTGLSNTTGPVFKIKLSYLNASGKVLVTSESGFFSIYSSFAGKQSLKFTASSYRIKKGDSVRLFWTTTGAEKGCTGTWDTGATRSSNNTEGDVLNPQETTEYSILCAGDGGELRETLKIVVEEVVPVVKAEASPSGIYRGQSSVISWESTDKNAFCQVTTGVDFLDQPKGYKDSVRVQPEETTDYTLYCSGTGGKIHKTPVKVIVSAQPAAATPPGPSGYTYCSKQNTFCSFTGVKNVAYGADGKFKYLNLTDGTDCGVAVFLIDPAPGVVKNCFFRDIRPAKLTIDVPPDIFLKTVAEGSELVLRSKVINMGEETSRPAKVAFFIDFIPLNEKGLEVSRVEGDSYLNVFDPQPWKAIEMGDHTLTMCVQEENKNSDCKNYQFKVISREQAEAPVGYTHCAKQNTFCSFTGTKNVAYGARGKFIYLNFTNGVQCDLTNFKSDPVPGVVKSCYIKNITPSYVYPAQRSYAGLFEAISSQVNNLRTILNIPEK